MNDEDCIEASRRWVQTVVVGLDLCPFAKYELEHNRLRFVVSRASCENELLVSMNDELQRLERDKEIETTLIIHPDVLSDFLDYNQFLDRADQLLEATELAGEYQVASFHPDYQYADTQPDEPGNYRNRSPFPMLHLLREDSVERVIDSRSDIHEIPERNIARMNELGTDALRRLLSDCLTP
ncbi:MAG: DUF1415 domain-containing protein [Pseudomonadota bacterium]